MTGLFDKFKRVISFIGNLFSAGQAIFYVAGVVGPIAIFIMIVGLKYVGFETISPALLGVFAILMLETAIGIYRFRTWQVNKQRKISRMVNPYIYLKSEDIECEITDDKGAMRTDTYVFGAKKSGVKHFSFFLFKTSAKEIIVNVLEGGMLSRSDDYANKTEYRVDFGTLQKGEEKTIILQWRIRSLVDAPFLSETLRSGFERLRFHLIFPKKIVSEKIMAYVEDYAGGAVVGDIQKLLIDDYPTDLNKKQVIWEVAAGQKFLPELGLTYTLQWQWK